MGKERFGNDSGCFISRRSFLKGAAAFGGATLLAGNPLAGGQRRAWAQAKGPIKMGFVTSYTGPYSTWANEQAKGIKMAIEEINAKGGVLGREVQLFDRDDRLNPGEAVKKFKELVEKENIDIMMGTLSAATVVAINEETKKLNMPYMAVCQSQEITAQPDFGPYTFHEAFTPYMTGQAQGKWLYDNVGKKVFFMVANYAWGNQIYDSFAKALQEKGGTNLGVVKHPLGTTDYSAFFPTIMAANPELLIVANAGVDQVNSLKQMVSFGLRDKMKIAWVLAETTTGKEAGQSNIAGIYFGGHFYWELEETIPTAKKFVSAFRTKWGSPPTGYAGYAYSGALELLGAIERAKALDPAKITKELEGREYDNYKGKQWWRACDHQSFQDWYVLKGREATKGEWGFFDILAKVPASESLERSCDELKKKA